MVVEISFFNDFCAKKLQKFEKARNLMQNLAKSFFFLNLLPEP